ncbi:MAG TPA: nucleotidyltransferase family protein [Longimicrobiales bacterium]
MANDATKDLPARPDFSHLTPEEQKSLTHGEFWIPEEERQGYQRALRALNEAGIQYVVSGLYALYEYTGIYRKTKDLDVFVEPIHVVDAGRVLKEAGFKVYIEQSHWIAKAMWGDVQTDLIYGMGNGMAFIDRLWWERSRPGILAATQVRIAPPEDLIWHRLFVSERHRSDSADVLHLIMRRGPELDWNHLVERVAGDWRLLLAQVHLFDFVYPGHREHVPHWVRRELYERAEQSIDEVGDPELCYGTMISRFSYAIDVNEWGFHDPRRELTQAAKRKQIVNDIVASDVWELNPTTKKKHGHG